MTMKNFTKIYIGVSSFSSFATAGGCIIRLISLGLRLTRTQVNPDVTLNVMTPRYSSVVVASGWATLLVLNVALFLTCLLLLVAKQKKSLVASTFSVGCSGATLICSFLAVVLALGLSAERMVTALSVYAALLSSIATYLCVKTRAGIQRVVNLVELQRAADAAAAAAASAEGNSRVQLGQSGQEFCVIM